MKSEELSTWLDKRGLTDTLTDGGHDLRNNRSDDIYSTSWTDVSRQVKQCLQQHFKARALYYHLTLWSTLHLCLGMLSSAALIVGKQSALLLFFRSIFFNVTSKVSDCFKQAGRWKSPWKLINSTSETHLHVVFLFGTSVLPVYTASNWGQFARSAAWWWPCLAKTKLGKGKVHLTSL